MTGALFALIALTGAATAQQTDTLPAFNGIRTPVSPAFVVLGVTPTNVERPNTPSDLALTVLSQSQGFTALPKDLGLELSPYWLFRHPKLQWRDDSTRTPGASLARTATLSLATADIGTEARPVTGLAFGARAAPFSGRLSRATIEQLTQLEDLLGEESALVNRLKAARRRELVAQRTQGLAEARTRADSQEVADTFAARVGALTEEVMASPEYKAAVQSTEEALQDFAVTREGFFLEAAAGVVWQAANGIADSVDFGRFGFWITASYQSPHWSFVAVNRVLGGAADSTDAIDIGLRVIHTARRYAISVEGSFRAFTQGGAPENQYRVTGGFDYELFDGLWLTSAFGQDFDPAAERSLIVQFGLSLNVAGERVAVAP